MSLKVYPRFHLSYTKNIVLFLLKQTQNNVWYLVAVNFHLKDALTTEMFQKNFLNNFLLREYLETIFKQKLTSIILLDVSAILVF